jgi:tetratricopeptide (TPR) repeat protein
MTAMVLLAASPALAEGLIRGSATGADGAPLQGVQVTLIPADPALAKQTTTSNKKGKFVIGLIRPNDYRLIAVMEGMRIARIDANIEVPDDKSLWAFHEELPQGSETPEFTLSGASSMTYDISFAPYSGDPGAFGTGLPIPPIQVIVGLIDEGKTEEALSKVRANLKNNPDSAVDNYLLGFILRTQAQHEEALAAVDKVLASDPTFEGAKLLKAKILEGKGELESAAELYGLEAEEAASLQVRHDSLLALALLQERLERFDEAAVTLEKLIEIDPEDAGAYKELADLYIRLGESEKAQAIMEKATGLDADPDFLYNLGAERFNASDFEAAAGYFTDVIEIAPDYKDAYLRLAYTKLNMGDRDAAIANLEKYLELSTEDDQEAQTARAILQQLKK